MTLTKAPSASENPVLRRWRVAEVVLPDGSRSRHVWGHDVTHDVGRASSAIRSFDPDTMTATTHSGRQYTLLGVPGNARKAEYVWNNWCRINGVVSELDVTHEYMNIEAQHHADEDE